MMDTSKLDKFGAGTNRGPRHRYGDVIHHEGMGGPNERLIAAPAGGHVALVQALVSCLPEPLRLLYVLVVPRGTNVLPGRYEAPTELGLADVSAFLADFSEFLERDGRHHLWVASPGYGAVVYDRHDLVYADGPLECFERQGERLGLRPGRPDVPGPHWHAYHAEFDAEQKRLLERFDWIRTELRDGDDW